MIDLGTCSAVVDSARVELPPTEFELLAILASRPGELVPSRELVQLIWPNDPVMNTDDLRWRIWNLRKRIGDRDRDRKIIGNRRGVGYFVDLPSEAVQVLQGSRQAEENDGPVALDPATARSEDSTAALESSTAPPALGVRDPEETSAPNARLPTTRRPIGRPAAVVLAATITSILLASSWAAGYWLSRRNAPAATGSGSPPAKTAPERKAKGDRQEKTTASTNNSNRRARARATQPRAPTGSGVGLASETSVNTGLGNAQEASQPSRGSRSSGGSNPNEKPHEKEPPPPPSQPNALLYHLFNSDSGDHYMTTSSSAANRKQAEGYGLSTEGRVFGARVEDTVAIALDSGSAFVYQDASSAPSEINVAPLYRLTKDGDVFYTVSSSLANQAQAQGWTRSTAGYVAT